MTLSLFVVAPAALLTDHRPHGDGLVAFGFIRELAARGHQLTVAAQRVDLRTSLPGNVRLYQLAGGGLPPPLARLAFMRRVRRLGRSEAFDVVHQLNPVELGVSLALADTSTPLVLGPYVPDWPGEEGGRIKRALRGAQQQRAATLLLSTPAAASKVATRGPLVRELPPGIDDRLWAPGRGGGGQDVLFLANLEARKGVWIAVEAFDRISAELPEARLLIAGAGAEAGAVRDGVRAMAFAEQVRFLGPLGRDQAVAAMQACDLFCVPSYGEPFGMTALEAMACARPVVASDAGGLRHLVSESGGRRFPPGDAEALAGALRELLPNPELRRAMGEHNRQTIKERYTWTRVVDRLEELYLEAIGERAYS